MLQTVNTLAQSPVKVFATSQFGSPIQLLSHNTAACCLAVLLHIHLKRVGVCACAQIEAALLLLEDARCLTLSPLRLTGNRFWESL